MAGTPAKMSPLTKLKKKKMIRLALDVSIMT